MYNRPYRFEFSDTASPQNYTLLRPNFVILCYDISDRRSLINVQEVWRKDVTRHYTHRDEGIPVMLLGLKRDLRVEGKDLIEPQEVGFVRRYLAGSVLLNADSESRPIELRRKCDVIDTQNVLL
jgi:GTPase SAR1 family protein